MLKPRLLRAETKAVLQLLVMIRTYFSTTLSEVRLRRRFPRSLIGRPRIGSVPCGARPYARVRLGSEDGFLLIEVLVSAMLVALIVVATVTGFNVVDRTTANTRQHSEAAVLAAQSQEQLRTAPASALDALAVTSHEYAATVGGTKYTITQSAKLIGPSGAGSCSVTEKSTNAAPNVQITSSVSWSQQRAASQKPVKQSSIITPPTGSALEVDVGNAPTPTAGVAGVRALVTYTPVGAASPVTLEAETGPPGCVVFGGIPATSATVEIPEKLGYVTIGGALRLPPKELTIAPNITTHDPVTFNKGGMIEAEFRYTEKTEFNGKPVKGDTFVVSNTNMLLPPEFQVGSTHFEYQAGGEEQYRALTSEYKETALTAHGSKYPQGDLFPFLEPQIWTVYAGDCTKNDTGSEAVSTIPPALVPAGNTLKVQVPTSYVALAAWTGSTSKNKGAKEAETLPVKITNTACLGSPIPDNASAATLVHEQKLTSAGELENPFQPFGAYTVCVAEPKKKKTYTVGSTNSTVAGTSPQIYIGQKSASERTLQQKAEEEAKTKREAEEAPARIKREKEETTQREAREKEVVTKASREKEEKTQKETREKEEATRAAAIKTEETNRAKWKSEFEKGKISKATLEKKEKEQTKTRETREAEEKTAREKREKEEKTTKENREKEEAAKVKREAEEKATKETREKEEAARAVKIAAEKVTKEAREKEETEEASNGVVVAEGIC
jgi:type II secretory pathway pseudopilin PulG